MITCLFRAFSLEKKRTVKGVLWVASFMGFQNHLNQENGRLKKEKIYISHAIFYAKLSKFLSCVKFAYLLQNK